VQHFYFDHNATTPVAPEVLEQVVACLGQVYGNASSIHHYGQAAKQRLEAARRQVAALVHADEREIVFTGGGTEADNMAILGVARSSGRAQRHAITSSIEHPAVLMTVKQLQREGVEATAVRVGGSGIVNPDDVRRALRPETVLISIMHANNETGAVQPVEEIARIAREAGVPFGAAAELAGNLLAADAERIAGLRDRLEAAVLERIPGSGINGSRWNRLPNTSNLYFDGVDGEAMTIALDLRGFAVSTGAACSSGAIAPSHVLTAMGLPDARARASMRFSLGRGTTAAQVDALAEAIGASVAHLRRISVNA